MKEQKQELKKQVEEKLLQKITDLEAVKLALEEDLKTSEGEELLTNQKLLDNTLHLLQELKLAHLNILTMDPES